MYSLQQSLTNLVRYWQMLQNCIIAWVKPYHVGEETIMTNLNRFHHLEKNTACFLRSLSLSLSTGFFLSATHSLYTLSVSEQDLGSTLVDLSQECELCQLSNCPQVAPCLGKWRRGLAKTTTAARSQCVCVCVLLMNQCCSKSKHHYKQLRI